MKVCAAKGCVLEAEKDRRYCHLHLEFSGTSRPGLKPGGALKGLRYSKSVGGSALAAKKPAAKKIAKAAAKKAARKKAGKP